MILAAVRSELLKLKELTYVTAIAGIVGFAIVSMIISIGNAGEMSQDRGPAGVVLTRTQLAAHDGLARAIGNSVTFVGIALLTIVAINVGGEYTRGTVRALLIRQPRRLLLVMSKGIALLVFTTLAAAVCGVAGTLTALLMAPASGVDTAAWGSFEGISSTLRAAASLAIALSGWAAMGLLLTTVVRAAAPAIGIGVAYALALEIILTVAFGAQAQWLPGQFLQTLARGGSGNLPYGLALLASVTWIGVCAATAAAVFSRRDVTS